jgi:hypothetical protein
VWEVMYLLKMAWNRNIVELVKSTWLRLDVKVQIERVE